MTKTGFSGWRSLWTDCSGLALIEFAYIAPLFMGFVASGTELANYAVKKTQVSQVALQVADNAARIGDGDPLANKQITEAQINDLFTGAGIHAGQLELFGEHERDGELRPNGRIILSSLETMANPNPTNRYRIRWQRCRGEFTKFHPQYGEAGKSSGTMMLGMGPAGRQVTAVAGTPVMFVEVRYRYKPLFLNGFAFMGYEDIDATAAMMVRGQRELGTVPNAAGIFNNEGAAIATCVVPVEQQRG